MGGCAGMGSVSWASRGRVYPSPPAVVYRTWVNGQEDRRRLDEAVARLGVPYELFGCDPALADTAECCAAYGFDLEESTIVFAEAYKAQPSSSAACAAHA